MNPSAIAIERLMDSILTVDLAEKIVEMRADRELVKRVGELGKKCNEGALTAEEKEEYHTYVVANEYIAILQSRARSMLKHQRA